MSRFQVVEGKQSNRYNHFADYTFERCTATDTRLMGVVAMRLSWRAADKSRDRLFQIIHLDFSEFGIDDYGEFFASTPDPRGGREVRDEWSRVSGSLGGREVTLPLSAALALIEEALAINELHYRNHDEDIQRFRRETLRRIAFLKSAAAEALGGESNTGSAAPFSVMALVCPKTLSACETVHYFLMRLCDRDFHAAAYLSAYTEEALRQSPFAGHGISSLMRSRLESRAPQGHRTAEHAENAFICKTITMSDRGYRYSELRLTVALAEGRRKVTSLRTDTSLPISEFEAALQLKQTEYITLYRLDVPPEEFNLDDSPVAARASISPAPNGLLYVLYTRDNTHVDTMDYFLDRDLYGAYLITQKGELVAMSRDIMKITVMEMDLQSSFLAGKLSLLGRYRFDTQVFQTFAETAGADFEDVIEPPDGE